MAVRSLGIYIWHVKSKCYDKVFIKTYHEMEKLLNHWKDENDHKTNFTLSGIIDLESKLQALI